MIKRSRKSLTRGYLDFARIGIRYVLISCLLCLNACSHTPRQPKGKLPLTPLFRVYSDPDSPRPGIPEYESEGGLVLFGRVEDENGSYFVTEAGGASILSSDLLLTSDHISIDPNSGAIYMPEFGVRRSIVIESGPGWQVRCLSEPIDACTTISFVNPPERDTDPTCWVPIPAHVLKRNNTTTPQGAVHGKDGILYIPAIVSRFRHIFEDLPEPRGLVAAHIKGNFNLTGSSGYPMLWYNLARGEWQALGVIEYGGVDQDNNRTWIIASRHPIWSMPRRPRGE